MTSGRSSTATAPRGPRHGMPSRMLHSLEKPLSRPARPRYPFHDRECVVTACGRLRLHRKKSTSQPSSPVKNSASTKSTTAFGWSASCTTISVTSTWSKEPCSPSTTRWARGYHPCLRHVPLPMCPGLTRAIRRTRRDLTPGSAFGGQRRSFAPTWSVCDSLISC